MTAAWGFRARKGSGKRLPFALFGIASLVAWAAWSSGLADLGRASAILHRAPAHSGATRVAAVILPGKEITTPGGSRGVGYVASIRGRRKSGAVTLCTSTELRLSLVVGQERLTMPDPPRPWVLDDELLVVRTPPDFNIALGSRPVAAPVPASMKKHCPSAWDTPEATYHERPIVAGERVQIVACRRGDTLEPCLDGSDLLSFGEDSARAVAARSRTNGGLAFGIAGVLAIIATLGTAIRVRRVLREGQHLAESPLPIPGRR